MCIMWWAPIPIPWNMLVSWVVAIGIGLWGSKLLLAVNRVDGKHREE
jgi:type IV secretory pathway VirB2 component (pilin)